MLVASDLIANNRPQTCPKQCVYNMFGFNAYYYYPYYSYYYYYYYYGLRVHMTLSQVPPRPPEEDPISPSAIRE